MEVLFEKRLARETGPVLKKRLSLISYEEMTPMKVIPDTILETDTDYGLSDDMLIYQMMNRNMEGSIRPLRVYLYNSLLIQVSH